jgi:hypothetical protein
VNFYREADGASLGDPYRIYTSGAGEKYEPGIDHKSILNWTVPPYYRDGGLGAPTVGVTVRVKLENPNDDDNAFVDLSDVFATITWGSGIEGGPDCQVMDFDVVHGGSVSVEAWSLNVEITYPDPGSFGVSPIHPIIRVDVSVGLGTTGKASVGSSATRTVKIGDLAVGATSPFLPIPMYAIGARIVNTDPLVPTLEVGQFRAAGGQVVLVDRVGKLQVSAIPIARGLGARNFNVNNFNAAISHNSAVIFDLSPN